MERKQKKLVELLAFVLILSLGTILRLWNLTYPLGLHGDEAWTGIEARRILEAGPIGLWSESALGQPSLPFYFTSIIFSLLGIGITQLRLSFAILNIASLPFFYLSIRLLFGRKIAIVTFFLFATSFIFIHFHRLAPTHSLFLVPFFPAVYFFLKSLKNQSWWTAILAGLFIGIGPYFYVGLRMLPIFLGAFFFYLSVTQKQFFSRNLPTILIISVTALTSFAPLGIYMLENQEEVMARTNIVSIFSEVGRNHMISIDKSYENPVTLIKDNIIKVLGMFHFSGDNDPQDNYNLSPAQQRLVGLFFLLGFIIQIKKIKYTSSVFLFLWFFLFLLGSILTVDAPNFRRTQPAIAAALVFAGIGIVNLYDFLYKHVRFKRILTAGTFFLVLYAGISSVLFYIDKFTTSQEIKGVFNYSLVKASSYLNTLPKDTYTYLYSSRWPYDYEVNKFLIPKMRGEKRTSITTSSFGKEHALENTVYIFFPEFIGGLKVVQKLYPTGHRNSHYDQNGELLFTSYFVPKSKNILFE